MRVFTERKIAKLLADLKPTIFRETHPIASFKTLEADPPGAQAPDFDDSAWADFHLMDYWGGYDKIAWFRATVPIPAHLRDKKLSLRFLVGPRDGGHSTAETLLYVDGFPLQAIDVWHEEAWLPPRYTRQDSIQIALRSWSSVLGVPDRRRFKVAELNWIDENAERYYFLAVNLLAALRTLDENDWRRVQMLEALNDSVRLVNFTRPGSDDYYATVGDAYRSLQASLEALHAIENRDFKPKVIAVGHSHIDLAWLWRWSHSREKAGRTFSTVLHLMDQYPDYRFVHSSPALYHALNQDYPDIFERVKAKIASGQWEITGGMWVEADTNISGGEALIRQFLYGKRYVRETFGKEMDVLWLPDVFGYSAALPQLIRKSGLNSFMTTKISWSQFNRFPYDTFSWRGIDGSEILTHFITAPDSSSYFYTYNGSFEPAQVKGLWDAYRDKRFNDELLLAFGWGDGGGGPTREMLESARVLKNLPGLPAVELGSAEPYFQRLHERLDGQDLAVWDGELYLELHRGTYTSQAANKRFNRKSEILYHDVEVLAALADLLLAEDHYPDLREGWELILFNQFHDILPGSSIRQVYEDSTRDYQRVAEIGSAALAAAVQRFAVNVRAETDSLVVFNTLSWPRDGIVTLPWTETLDRLSGQALHSQVIEEAGGKALLVDVQSIPALGYATLPLVGEAAAPVDAIHVSARRLENRYFRIELNAQGQLTSIWDKARSREVLAPGARGNLLQAFEDRPLESDAWDIDLFYQEKMQEVTDLVEAVVEETGPVRGTLRLVWRFYGSTITQRVSLYQSTARIDFRTEIDWHEQHVLLKVAFPVNIRSRRATYDIQFGSLERPTHWNTSWDYARFEVALQKWMDLSEGDYGVALLNDCKYGGDVHDNVLRLTLLKSATSPDEQADQGRHTFTYGLFPHANDRQAVVAQGYALNLPLHAVVVPAQPGALPPDHSLTPGLSTNLIVETVKRAEDGDGWIIRVYDYLQQRHKDARLTFGRALRRAVECNLVEEGESPVQIENGDTLVFPITPFEIKTFRVWFVEAPA